ncbi:hypothetical protein QSJ18_16650 [Gordonia sp. ABSL1-1]|uniref:SCO6745 family protein n=1 Tax=Gordonia sp. ABSL1-1 TaxID=3053923 RepID=UPI002572D791|nr:hypothetical protein [Gordonia sp. ABSL1-1]MDL9938382.1 hypothetical protein [Gordonia sp. ABSL1-1]
MTSTSAARTAYETLEPFHILAYFNPGLRSAQADLGLDPYALYFGGRAAPLGACSHPVVTSTFYNFEPGLVARSWDAVLAAGLDRVAARRDAMLDEQLRTILGAGIADDPQIADLADAYTELAGRVPLSGRPLAAAWAGVTLPDTPHLRLWYAIAILREWRGDNHIATLVGSGLNGIDAIVFHEATLPDPTVTRRIMGRPMAQLTRGWDDDAWEAAVDRLVAAGLAEREGDRHRLTPDGAALYDDIEAATDALGESLWSTAGIDEVLTRTRPLVKAVLDAGVLPGTTRKEP